ncbi:hypothetical protein F4604DRAFT_1744520 [Suillus subluteus]|nr:hypothetical protein F4604DRAFT_1744520 [Suillus subluteus]
MINNPSGIPEGSPYNAPSAPGQRRSRPSSNPTGRAHSTAPLANTINSHITQFPALNGIRPVPPASNPASQPQSNLSDLPPNSMSSDLIESMSALSMSASEDPDPSMFRSVPPASNLASQPQPNLSDLPPNFMSSDFIQSMSALEDLDPSMFRTDFEQDFREWFEPTGVDAITLGQRGPSSNHMGSAHDTAPPTPNAINSSITQSPALNGIRSVPPISNPASQPQPNLSNFMSSDFIQSMAALEDLDPSMFRTDFEQDFREWFDPTGVDLR